MENFNRLNDRFFKFLFANPEYKDLLIEFVNDVLDNTPKNAVRIPPVEDLFYADREAVPQSGYDKSPRFDVIARTCNNKILHIEVQVAYDANLLPRLMHYASRTYAGETRIGEKYPDIQVVFITLVNYNLFHDSDDWYELHRIVNINNGAWRLRGMEFHFIDIAKLRAKMIKDKSWPKTGLERLLYYLGSIGGERDMQAIAKEDSMVDKMLKLEDIFKENPGLFAAYTDWEFEKRMYNANIKAIEGHGEDKGTIKTLAGLVKDDILTLSEAASRAGMTEAEFKAKMAEYGVWN